MDRAEGASAPEEGVVQIMFNRITTTAVDDKLGVGESANENMTINVLHRIVLEGNGTNISDLAYRKSQVELDQEPVIVSLKTKHQNTSFTLNRSIVDREFDSEPTVARQEYLRTTFDVFENGRIGMRIINQHETEVIAVNIKELCKNLTQTEIQGFEEVSIDFNWTIDELLQGTPLLGGTEKAAISKSCDATVCRIPPNNARSVLLIP